MWEHNKKTSYSQNTGEWFAEVYAVSGNTMCNNNSWCQQPTIYPIVLGFQANKTWDWAACWLHFPSELTNVLICTLM